MSIAALFVPAVSCVSVTFGDDERPFASIELPPELIHAVPKRRLEFLAGRHCAGAALERLGYGGAPIPIGPRGAPVWPAGVVGSITHAGGFAAAAVARRSDAAAIGLDAEPLMDARRAREVAPEIATPEELDALRGDLEEDAFLTTTVFSAKEALFKCLHASVGRYFDFLDARVVGLDRDAGAFDVELRTTLGPFNRGTQFRGRFLRDGAFVRTGITLPPDSEIP